MSLLLKLTNRHWQETCNQSSSLEVLAALRIVAHVGYLPLGIIQAAEIIVHDSCLLSDFLDAYNDRELIEGPGSNRLSMVPGGNYSLNLSTVWNMSFESLDAERQSFLNLISFLDPDRIQLQLLWEGAARAVKMGVGSLAFMDNIRKLNQCKGPLVRSSLVTQNETLRELWMHRLVQQSCHLRMSPTVRQESFNKAYWVVKAMWPVPARENRHGVSLWPVQQAYFAHVQSLAHFYDQSQKDEFPLQAKPEFAELLCDASL